MKTKADVIENEIPAHKKKSKKKGQPRANHKHMYETVLLVRYFRSTIGEPHTFESKLPTKVCTICGRIDYVDYDESLYDMRQDDNIKWARTRELSEKALNLPEWYVNDLEKFATKMED